MRRIASRSTGAWGQGVREEARQEADVVGQQVVGAKVVAHRVDAGRHPRDSLLAQVELVLEVDPVCGRRNARERVGDPGHALILAVGDLQGAQEDRRAAVADAGLQEVAGDAVGEHPVGAALEVVEPGETDHRVREARAQKRSSPPSRFVATTSA